MTITPTQLATLVQNIFPINLPHLTVESSTYFFLENPLSRVGPISEHADGALYLSLQTVLWEPGPPRVIYEYKQQEIRLIPAHNRTMSLERLEACLQGWRNAVEQINHTAHLKLLMPRDLWPYRALNLKRPQTAEDFARAFLVQSRLGRLVLP